MKRSKKFSLYRMAHLGLSLIMLCLVNIQLGLAQETNCTNGIDDDGDGWRDLADTDCPVQPDFNCFYKAILLKNSPSDMYSLDLTTGTTTLIAANIVRNPPYAANREINAIGYNSKDKYIWGIRQGAAQVARIGSDGSVAYFNIPGLSTTIAYITGDVSSDGVLYFKEGPSATALKRIDLDPASPTYLTLLSDIILSPALPTNTFPDMAFNPIDGKLYGMAGITPSCSLIRINPTTGALDNLGIVPNINANEPSSSFGAVYFGSDGTFYPNSNASGKIWAIPNVSTLTGSGNALATLFSTGVSSSVNDGARNSTFPLLNLNITLPTICLGQSNTLTVSNFGGGSTYSWAGEGVVNTNATSTTAIPTTAGNKVYSVTITTAQGCTASTTGTFNVIASPSTVITATPNPICRNATLSLSAPAGATTYVWAGNGIVLANATTTTAVPTASGTQAYTVTITGANGCSASGTTSVTVNPNPVADITIAETSGVANNDGIICIGSSVQLTGTGGATYAWSGAVIGTPSSNPQNILPTATGTYTVTVSSLAGCIATASQLITVNPLPTATIVPNGGGGGFVCNTQQGLTLTASGGTTYVWSTGASTAAINIASTQATTTYTVTVTNSNNCSASTSVIVNAVGTGGCNQVPIAINDINNTFMNTPISGQVLTNDSDPDAGQTLTVNTTPSGVSGGSVILNSNGTYTFTPTIGFLGVAQFTYTVCDNGTPQACDQATVYINVIASTVANNPPAPGNDVIQTLINIPVSGTIATNDIDPDGNINPLGFTLITPPSASAGVLTVNTDGTYTFSPTAGFTGVATFTYQVCDLGMPVLCTNATGVIEVYPNPSGNDAPNAQDDAVATIINTPITINALINDSDPNGDLIMITSITSPIQGNVFISSGNIVYTPAAGFVGTVNFTYQICDSGAPTLCDIATVYVTVLPVPPFAENDINNTLPNTAVTGDVMTNDENLLLGFTVNTTPIISPIHGSVILNGGGNYTYTPTNGSTYIGVDSFQYEICNPGALCDIATVYINITANTSLNNPPAPGNDIAQTLINTTVVGAVANNDIDPDSNINPTGFTLVTPPTTGVITFNTDGTFAFVPANNYVGTTSFTYQVCDLGSPALCVAARGIIEVLPDLNSTGNDAPNAQDDAAAGTGIAPITGNVLTNDSDPNGNALTVNTTPIVNVPASAGTLVLNSNGTFTFTPVSGFTGTTSFVYRICDNGIPSQCDDATVYITVYNCTLLAGACTAQNDECMLHQGQVRLQVQGGKLPYTITWTPAHGNIAQPAQITTEGGTLTIDNMHGNTTYLFIVTDAHGCVVP